LKKQFCYAIAASALILAVGLGCKRQETGGSTTGDLATVDGTSISMADFNDYLVRMPSVEVSAQGRQLELPVVGSLGLQALKELVQQKLLLEIAKDEGVYPTDAEIKKELDYRTKTNADYVRILMNQGFAMHQIQEDLRLELARNNIVTKGVTVTDADAKNFIKTHPKNFTNPPSVDALWIVVKTEKAKDAAQKELASGSSFQTVAMTYSAFPNAKASGGKFPSTDLSQIGDPVKGWLTNTPLLKPTGWHQVQGQWLNFYINSRTPAKPMVVDGDMIESVRRNLALQKGSQTTDLNKRMVDKLKSSKIDIDVPFLATPWKEASDRLKASPTPAR